MYLSKKPPRYIIPEYSLTGDLLAYLTCGLQYRYHSKGSLPPSTPVQLWFGEFLHSIMEEAFRRWQQNSVLRRFPWSWDPDIRTIELEIDRRLRARGLYPTPRLFCPYTANTNKQGLCPDTNHPHKLLASRRSEAAINTWAPHLFPLIHEAEVRLKGIRPMPQHRPGVSRSNYYGVNGIVDVISSVNLQSTAPGNLILHYLNQNPEVREIIRNLNSEEYEIIIDYKGMRRPSIDTLQGQHNTWQYHAWQILTYAWLRSLDPQSKPIVAGILFYLNELAPSRDDIERLKEDIQKSSTDVMPEGLDRSRIANWSDSLPVPQISASLREERSIRIIPRSHNESQHSLQQFDQVVNNIENCVLSEMGGNGITSSWQPNPDQRNCTACDFKTYCPNPAPRRYNPTVP